MSASQLAAVAAAAMDAQLDAARWVEVCDLIAEATRATAFMVFEYDTASHSSPLFHGSRATRGPAAESLVRIHMEGGAEEDRKGYSALARLPEGRIYPEIEILGLAHDDELPTNSFRERVLGVLGSKSRSAAKLNDIGPWVVVAALQLPILGADLPPGLRADVNSLLPLLGKALETGRTVRGLTARYGALLEAFDLLDFGCALVDREGRLFLANASFSELAGDRDGIMVAAGVVRPTHPDDRPALSRVIAAALDPAAMPAASLCALRRRSGRLPFVVRSAPLRHGQIDSRQPDLSLLLVLDPEDRNRVSARGIGAFGALTRAELEICDLLVRGFAIPEIARIRDKSPETVRDQSKSIIAKLACRSRLDLLRLALVTSPQFREVAPPPPAGHPPSGG